MENYLTDIVILTLPGTSFKCFPETENLSSRVPSEIPLLFNCLGDLTFKFGKRMSSVWPCPKGFTMRFSFVGFYGIIILRPLSVNQELAESCSAKFL